MRARRQPLVEPPKLTPKDLVVLTANKNIEFAVRELLAREADLDIAPPAFELFVHPQRDPGCLRESYNFLRLFCRRFRHALVVFDREGCGRDSSDRAALESQVETRLAANGWGNRAAAIVIDPELECWVWVAAGSTQIDRVLGWAGSSPGLREHPRMREFFFADRHKPARPKEAFERALSLVRKQRSSSIYGTLARTMPFDECADPAFQKMRQRFVTWFPA